MKIFTIILFINISLISCNLKSLKSNEEIIKEINKNFTQNQDEYPSILGIITSLLDGDINIYKDNRISLHGTISNKDKNKIRNFMIKNGYSFIEIKQDKTISFINYNYKNKNSDVCYLVYHVPDGVNYKELYSDFEIVKGNERPTKNGGWIYLINPQWIIYSPHKTNKNKDVDELIQWFAENAILYSIVGIIFLIIKLLRKKYKKHK
jgi:hypothetical protein